PHQKAAFYRKPLAATDTLTSAEQLHGKELSYNNINDANAALQIVKEFEEPAVVVVKHMNPCGVGIGESIYEAFRKAHEADPVSIFGGIVAANRIIDEATALLLKEIFLEIILAPGFTDEALAVLTHKKNIRLLKVNGLELGANRKSQLVVTSIDGGMIVQDSDVHSLQESDLKVVTDRAPSEEELKQLLFAWKVVKHVKSNAIVLAKDDMTIGV